MNQNPQHYDYEGHESISTKSLLHPWKNNYFLTRISALVKEMGGNVFRNYEF